MSRNTDLVEIKKKDLCINISRNINYNINYKKKKIDPVLIYE
jgi:hypothetical protein